MTRPPFSKRSYRGACAAPLETRLRTPANTSEIFNANFNNVSTVFFPVQNICASSYGRLRGQENNLLDAAQTAASLTARMTIVISVEREKIRTFVPMLPKPNFSSGENS